jgi:membrane-bound inhibitor of C-type lysozyme
MTTLRNLARGLAPAMMAAITLQACTAEPPADGEAVGEQASAAAVESPAPEGMEPGTSLAFEWSANGFEQVPAQYEWTGSGKRDDVFQPNLSLSVPETDDAIWSSSCEAGGKVTTQLYLAPPKGMEGGRATFRFETDQSARTLSYPARYVADGQYDGFTITQSPNDPMFAEMKAGRWAYIQIGEGSDATKLRISLAKAAKAVDAFLPACSKAARPAQSAAASVTTSYACEDGRTITASYLGNESATPVVRLAIGDEVLLLSQAISGSGARYESNGAGQKVQWLTKADQGVLIVADANDAAGSGEQITNCRSG